MARRKTSVQGIEGTTAILRRLPDDLVAQIRKTGMGMGQEMVTLARARVPVDSGQLLNGIAVRPTNHLTIFELRASATNPRSHGVDYARFVEFGTAGGKSGKFREITSQAGLFGDWMDPDRVHPTKKRRRSRRTHGGSKAKPFFFGTAKEVMSKHTDELRKMPVKVGASLGLATEKK